MQHSKAPDGDPYAALQHPAHPDGDDERPRLLTPDQRRRAAEIRRASRRTARSGLRLGLGGA